MPVEASHVAPSSRVIHDPPHDTAATTVLGSRGSGVTLWTPGQSYPPPNHWARAS